MSFDMQIRHFRDKYLNLKSAVKFKAIELTMKSECITRAELKQEFENNSERFRKLVYAHAKTLVPGRISCTTYAVVVATIADELEIPYVAKAGYCIQKSHPHYEAEIAEYNKRKNDDGGHPLFATHVFIEANDKIYEYYNGDTDGIDHLDCEII